MDPTAAQHLHACHQKAFYLAYQSTAAAAATRVGMMWALLILSLPLLNSVVLAIETFERECGHSPYPRQLETTKGMAPSQLRTRCALWATLTMACMAVCMTTYIAAVQHEFYCAATLREQIWLSGWVFAGLIPGLLTLIALGNWVHVLVLYALGRMVFPPAAARTWKAPFGLWVIVAPVAAAIAAALVLGTVLCAVVRAVVTCNPEFLTSELPAEIKSEVKGEGGNVDLGMLNMMGVKGANDDFTPVELGRRKRANTTSIEWF
ncbi:hypothetical protein LTR53_008757 [Teratosphaeriaceae sp. CCFEE 6253]|nr:hypothetical protein LTR53_008757 [Teratosphaeriaceae sp. CCFEE 6253]